MRVELGAVFDVGPGGVGLVVEGDDGVAGLDAGGGRRGSRGRRSRRRRGGDEELHDLVVGHVEDGHEEEGEEEVGGGAGEGDDGALPAGVVLELAGV